MKYILALVVGLTLLGNTAVAFADTYVQGYYRSDGTYVQPHWRSSPNSTTLDNWSTRGNVNPYTGQRGTRSPYGDSFRSTPRSAFQPVTPRYCNPCLYDTPRN